MQLVCRPASLRRIRGMPGHRYSAALASTNVGNQLCTRLAVALQSLLSHVMVLAVAVGQLGLALARQLGLARQQGLDLAWQLGQASQQMALVCC